MKKSLTLLLAMAMVFSMFATVAFADTPTTTSTTDIQAKVQALESAGVLNGFPDGSMHLNDNMTRGQFAKVAALILGLDVPTTVTVPSYTDTASNWASAYIEAATKAGLLNGVGMGKFDPNGEVTIEQMAKVLDLGLKLDTSSTAAVSGTVSDWAKAYVAAAVGAGLIPPSTDYTTAATRSQLVSAGYAAYQEVKGNGVTVTSSTAVDANTVSVTFSDGVTKQFTLTTPLQLGVAANVPVTYNGVSYTVTVTLQQLSIAKAAATAADTVTVTFNQAVADTANAKATLTNMGANVSTTASWSDDKTQLILKADSNLLTGQYMVTIDGLNIPDGQNTSSFMVTAAAVSKITIDDTAYVKTMYSVADDPTSVTQFKALAKAEDISASYKLYDQYGNDVTSNYANLNVSVSSGSGNVDYSNPGTIEIQNVDPSFDSMIISIVDTDNGTNAVQTVQIKGEKKLDSITLSAPQPLDGDTSISSDNSYVLPVVAKDQYGNDYSFDSFDGKNYNQVEDDTQVGLSSLVTIISTNPSVLKADGDIVVNSDGKIEINKFEDFSGTQSVTLTAIVNSTGKQSSVTFSVNGGTAPAVPILVSPTSRMSKDYTDTDPFKLQLNVNDNFGNAMSASDIVTNATGTDKKINISVSGAAALASTPVVSDGTNAYIQLKAVDTGTAYISVTIGAKFTSIRIPVTDNKVVTSISLSVDKSEALFKDNAASSGQIKLIPTFKDQFGGEVTDDNATAPERAQHVDLYATGSAPLDYLVSGTDKGSLATVTTATYVTVGDLLAGNVKVAPNAAPTDKESATLGARLHYTPQGSSSATDVTTSSTVGLIVPKDASGLTFVADPGTVTVYNNGGSIADDATALDSAYAVTLGVDGKDGDNLVALPAGSFTASPAGSTDIAAGNVDPTDPTSDVKVAGKDGSDGDQAIVAVVVNVDGATKLLNVPVTIKTGTPVAQSIDIKDANGDAVAAVSVDSSATLNFTNSDSSSFTSPLYFDVQDQYGTDALNSQLSIYVNGSDVLSGTTTKIAPNTSYTLDQLGMTDTNTTYTITAICNSVIVSAKIYVK